MPLVNCKINFILTGSADFVITNSTDAGKSKITDVKLYGPGVSLSTQNNTKLLQQLKAGFKRTT